MSNPIEYVHLRQQQDFQFEIDFGAGLPTVQGDLPAPMGQGRGPTPEQLLAAAVGNCLSDSLLFALRKYKQAPDPIHTEVSAEVGRNAQNRQRVVGLTARITLGVPAATLEHLDRVLESFENFCTVASSVSQGIPLTIEVLDSTGQKLK
jgi:uncharacterized OsmC-like protein